jgi:SAM-dependent methyltransferase
VNDAYGKPNIPSVEATTTAVATPVATPDQYNKDFWLGESPKFARPHYRLEKGAQVINALAGGRDCTLLDVGCGPATLMTLLRPNIHYFGIDMAIPVPAPNLREINILKEPIAFDNKRFDIVSAQGLFEYLSDQQANKLGEIARLLDRNGTFVTTYTNFGHRKSDVYEAFSNVQPLPAFRKSLERYFNVNRSYPVSHNWQHGQPVRTFMRAANMRLNINIPVVSPALAVEYFFICSPRQDDQS